MSEFVERVKGHSVFTTDMPTLGAAIDSAFAREGNDARTIDSLERVRTALAYCGKRLAASDPYLLDPGTLNALTANITNARTELLQFAGNGNPGHLSNAQAHVDAFLPIARTLPAVQTRDDLTFLGEAAGSYRLVLEKNLQQAHELAISVSAESEAVKSKLAEITAEIAAEKTKIVTASADQVEKFAAAQASRAEEFTKAQTERLQNLTAATTEHQNQFTSAQETRAKDGAALLLDFTTKLTEQNTAFASQREAAIRDYNDKLNVLHTENEEAAKEIISAIERHKKHVETLAGVVGNVAVTSGYLTVANEARDQVVQWQRYTLLSLIGLIIVAAVVAFAPIEGADFAEGFARRVFVSLAFGIFAAYAARQAANFWQVERRNRRVALELEALGPYMTSLPEPVQQKLREEIANRIFAVPDIDEQKSKVSEPTSIVALFKDKDLRQGLIDLMKAGK